MMLSWNSIIFWNINACPVCNPPTGKKKMFWILREEINTQFDLTTHLRILPASYDGGVICGHLKHRLSPLGINTGPFHNSFPDTSNPKRALPIWKAPGLGLSFIWRLPWGQLCGLQDKCILWNLSKQKERLEQRPCSLTSWVPASTSVMAITEKSPYRSPLASMDTCPAIPREWDGKSFKLVT